MKQTRHMINYKVKYVKCVNTKRYSSCVQFCHLILRVLILHTIIERKKHIYIYKYKYDN